MIPEAPETKATSQPPGPAVASSHQGREKSGSKSCTSENVLELGAPINVSIVVTIFVSESKQGILPQATVTSYLHLNDYQMVLSGIRVFMTCIVYLAIQTVAEKAFERSMECIVWYHNIRMHIVEDQSLNLSAY